MSFLIGKLPGHDDCLGKIVTVSASVLKNRSWGAFYYRRTTENVTGFVIAVVNHPPKTIEVLGDGCVDVGPHVLGQEVLVLGQVSCQVTLPRVKVAVESSVRNHGRGNIGIRAWRDGNDMGSPRVSQVT